MSVGFASIFDFASNLRPWDLMALFFGSFLPLNYLRPSFWGGHEQFLMFDLAPERLGT